MRRKAEAIAGREHDAARARSLAERSRIFFDTQARKNSHPATRPNPFDQVGMLPKKLIEHGEIGLGHLAGAIEDRLPVAGWRPRRESLPASCSRC